MLVSDRICPVCESVFVCDLQEIYLQRQETVTSQYYCMDCQSFFHISGFVEAGDGFADDTRWLVGHPGDYSRAILDLKSLFKEAKTCFEAGCGAGSLLSQLKLAGIEGRGVDPNPVAVEHARKYNQVEATQGYFERLSHPVDIILAVDVLEHLEEPRNFFVDLVESVKPGGGIIVRVPTVDRDRWEYLRSACKVGSRDQRDPFMDNSVHITHFSSQGLVMMGESLGAKFIQRIDQDLHVFKRHDESSTVQQPPNVLARVSSWLFRA